MPGPDTEHLEADKACQQAEAAKASLKEIDSLNPNVTVKKADSEENQVEKHSETTSSNSFQIEPDVTKVIIPDIMMEFAPNAEADGESENENSENKDSENEDSETKKPDNNAGTEMKFEMSKSDTFHQKIYRETETYFSVLIINPLNNKAKKELEKLNKKIKKWNVKNEYPKEDLE